ncbi:MAG: WYL domain-containing protein [Clostridia bacterium]
MSDTSLHKINQYRLLDDLSDEDFQNNTLTYLDKIISAVNNFACVSFKRLDYVVNENELKEVIANKAVLMFPTNIDIIDNQLYMVGYHINSGENLELEYYRIDRLAELRVVRTPKYVQNKVASFKDKIWQFNDPLHIAKNVLVNLQIRVYAVNSNKVFEMLRDRFKESAFIVNQFHQFVDISIENAIYDESLVGWFLQLANYIEVFKPLELRDKIKEEIPGQLGGKPNYLGVNFRGLKKSPLKFRGHFRGQPKKYMNRFKGQPFVTIIISDINKRIDDFLFMFF